MTEVKEKINNETMLQRWSYLEQSWNHTFSEIDSLMIIDGEDEEESIKIKTSAIQHWLFGKEFLGSCIIILPKKIMTLGNKETTLYRETLQKVLSVLKVEILSFDFDSKDPKGSVNNFINKVMSVIGDSKKKIGVFSKEKQVGKMAEEIKNQIKEKGFNEIDISANVQQLLCIKDSQAIHIQSTCAKATEYLFGKFVDQIEKAIDIDSKPLHSTISRNMENSLINSKKELSTRFGIDPQFFDFTYTPVVQSGKKFSLKINCESNDDCLVQNYVLLNMACKYHELNVNVFRTLIINPSDQDKAAYRCLLDMHKFLIAEIKEGVIIKDVFNKAIEMCREKYPNYVNNLPSNFGFGIGWEFRESCLLIEANNQTIIKPGMIFSVITSLKDIVGREGVLISFQLGDTVEVTSSNEHGVKVLTSGVPRLLSEVGYVLEEEKLENTPSAIPQVNLPEGQRQTRLATRNVEYLQAHQQLENLKKHQKELLNLKMADIEERVQSGNLTFSQTENSKLYLENMKSLSMENIKVTNKNKIHIDNSQFSIILPIDGQMIPFHISCLKNVTRHSDGTNSILRINFQTPGSSSGGIIFPIPTPDGPKKVYIKELTYRSSNINAHNEIVKQVKELQKRCKGVENEVVYKSGEKFNLGNQLKSLNDLRMRPYLTGRKTTGTLTGFQNGFRFVSSKKENFEFPISIIKHAFFQPCSDNMIVLLHFTFKTPISINGKPHIHVQFYSEVCGGNEDLNDFRNRRGRKDSDEMREELMEEQAKAQSNKLFLDFVDYIQSKWNSSLKFDSPYEDYGFYGSVTSSNVFLMPTAYCLVSLLETPFTVVALEDIELVSLERIDNKIKHFDMIIVFKDYTRPVLTINNVEKSELINMKIWLDGQDILIIEGGTLNLKWDNLLKQIRQDPKKFFIEDGGWRAFIEDDEELEDEEEEDDSSFYSE